MHVAPRCREIVQGKPPKGVRIGDLQHVWTTWRKAPGRSNWGVPESKKAKRKREQPKTEKEIQGPFQVWVCDSAADGPKLKMGRIRHARE
jgi:hypothetical protein